VEQKNFDTYNVMRIAEMPQVDVIVMPSGGFVGGVGEPTIAVAAPAVLNAIAAATRQAHPLVPFEEHRPASGLSNQERRATAALSDSDICEAPAWSLSAPPFGSSGFGSARGSLAPVWGERWRPTRPPAHLVLGLHRIALRRYAGGAVVIGRAPAEIVTHAGIPHGPSGRISIMDRVAKGFTDDEIKAIADWYAGAQKE